MDERKAWREETREEGMEGRWQEWKKQSRKGGWKTRKEEGMEEGKGWKKGGREERSHNDLCLWVKSL